MAAIPDHAEPGHCPRCGKAVVVGHWEGLKVYVRSIAVPLEDALTLQRHGVPVWRIVIERGQALKESEFGQTGDPSTEGEIRGLRFYEWSGSSHPATGALYVDHRCGIK